LPALALGSFRENQINKLMNKHYFILGALWLGMLFLAGCGTPDTSDKPWDKPLQEDNRPGYKADDSPPLNRDAR
jgi:hypothetical protein